MLHLYSHNRYLATLEPVSFARSPKLQSLLMHLFERLEGYGYKIGEYLAHDGDQLLRELLALHSATFSLDAIADDYDLMQKLFTQDLIELNKFEPCEAARKPRPHLKLDPVYERLKIKKSGDRYMDDLADLATMLNNFDMAVNLTHQLSQSQVDHFIFRYNERNRDPEQLINEQNQEFFFTEWLQDDWNREYMATAFKC